jgi:hypothetical protein
MKQLSLSRVFSDIVSSAVIGVQLIEKNCINFHHRLEHSLQILFQEAET